MTKRSTVEPDNRPTTIKGRMEKGLPRSSLRSMKDKTSSPATHVTFFTDDEEEKKSEDDVQPLLSHPSHETKVQRRKSKQRTFNSKALEGKQHREQHRDSTNGADDFPTPAESSKKGCDKGRFSLARLGRRLSSRLSIRRTTEESPLVTWVDEEVDDVPDIEQDPVMQVFESRSTQRVRFALEEAERGEDAISETEKKTEEQITDDGKSSSSNIKQFMSRALFGTSKSSNNLNEEMKAEVASLGGPLVWESAETPTGPEVVHTTKSSRSGASELLLSFSEDPQVRTKASKLLDKAYKAEHRHFRYEYAVKCYLRALNLLKGAKYPDNHPTVVKTLDMLNNAHHVLSSYNNSAKIVKMGIKYEDAGELVRALKMYTIAYRIRRDNLSRNHPSLVVLLNMLGSIQIKRGELQEAMQIYELALNDAPVIFKTKNEEEESQKPIANLLAKSVTYREMGVIYERRGKADEALNIYHKSIECVLEWKEAVHNDMLISDRDAKPSTSSSADYSIADVRLSKAVSDRNGTEADGEMEVWFGSERGSAFGVSKNKENAYQSFFPAHLEAELETSKSSTSLTSSGHKRTRQDAHADMDLALTLHQIAQLHRCQGEYARALDAYEVSLLGMKYALGKHHPNVAAVLGNIGNLQKEMGDMDAAYSTYQEVLGIESYRLGLSHPDVAITLHNIATIDAARGNYEHALHLYRKVIGLERKLFGDEHISVAIAAACMGDVYEKIGEFSNAMESYEEAVRIKSACLGRHSIEVARLLHKLGKLAFLSKDFHMADSFLSRAVLMYRLNKIDEEHPWTVDANRDTADIDAALAMGGGRQFEC